MDDRVTLLRPDVATPEVRGLSASLPSDLLEQALASPRRDPGHDPLDIGECSRMVDRARIEG